MRDEFGYGEEEKKIVYINKKRILKKAVEKAGKDAERRLKEYWKNREKNENIRLLQVPIPNMRNPRKRKGD